MAAVIIGTIIHDRCIVTLNPALPDETLAADIESLKTPVVIARSEDWQRAAVRGAVERAGALGIEITGDRADPARVVTKLRSEERRVANEGVNTCRTRWSPYT